MKLYIEVLIETEEPVSFDNLTAKLAELLEGSTITLDHIVSLETLESRQQNLRERRIAGGVVYEQGVLEVFSSVIA